MTLEVKKFIKEAEQAAISSPPSDLVNQLKQVMADNFLFYFKSHSFHWNVVGKDFPQYHEFFSSVYTSAFGAVDRIAEEIRALDEYAPKSLDEMIATSSLSENKSDLDGLAMIRAIADDNQKILGGLLATQRMAEAANQVGLANYLQDLYDQHKKLAWMLSSILK